MIAYSCSSVSDAIQKNVSKWIKSVDVVSQNWIDIDAGNDLFSKCTNQLPEPISPAGTDVAYTRIKGQTWSRSDVVASGSSRPDF